MIAKKIKNPPHSLKDLTYKRFRKKIVIESPVSSAPGLSFFTLDYSTIWRKRICRLLAKTDPLI